MGMLVQSIKALVANTTSCRHIISEVGRGFWGLLGRCRVAARCGQCSEEPHVVNSKLCHGVTRYLLSSQAPRTAGGKHMLGRSEQDRVKTGTRRSKAKVRTATGSMQRTRENN